MRFEEIVHHLEMDLGPMDIPEEARPHDVLCTVYTYSQGYFQFTAETADTQEYVEYVHHMLSVADIVNVKDIHGAYHLLRVSDVAHITILEEKDDQPGGEAEGSSGKDPG